MSRPRVYVAGPISKGDISANIAAGIAAGLALLRHGYAVYIPHFSHTVDPGATVGSPSYEMWLDNDFTWIAVCDAVLRLPGESAGADREVQFANSRDIPVYASIPELEEAFPTS